MESTKEDLSKGCRNVGLPQCNNKNLMERKRRTKGEDKNMKERTREASTKGEDKNIKGGQDKRTRTRVEDKNMKE